jgi:GTP-binding protein EngB required for normal cell division
MVVLSDEVKRLCEMGFPESIVRVALSSSETFEEAVQCCLMQNSSLDGAASAVDLTVSQSAPAGVAAAAVSPAAAPSSGAAETPCLKRGQRGGSEGKRKRAKCALAATAGWHMPHKFRCPISGDLMDDPVIAQDGRSYERELIKRWFGQCHGQGKPLTSPVTREPMNPELRSNPTLKQSIAELRETQQPPSHSSIGEGTPGTVATVHKLGALFAQLDPLRELLAMCLDGWQPPALVVVGNENSGKSSQLERLCMMPIFPHDEAICTRLPIEVRLRRGPVNAPRLESFNVRTRKVEESFDVPMESANVDVRNVMNRLVKLQNGTMIGVSSERAIRLRVQSPNVPNLDLVDLPGVVTSAAVGEPENMPQQTRDLVTAYIGQNQAHSMFLCTIDANTAPNSSAALALLRDKRVLDKTIGVITRCDRAALLPQKTQVKQRLAQTGDAVVLKPHGYVATMNAPINSAGCSNLELLAEQALAEPRWFAANNYQDEVNTGLATSDALLAKINVMFMKYVKDSWVPETLKKLTSEEQRLQMTQASLGLPPAFGVCRPASTWLGSLRTAAQAAVSAVLTKEMPSLTKHFAAHMKQLTHDLHAILTATQTLPVCDPRAVHQYLQETQRRIHGVLDAANMNDDMLDALRAALEREDTSFKLARFPQLVDALVNTAREGLGTCRCEFEETQDERAAMVAQLLNIAGTAVTVKHSWTVCSTVVMAQVPGTSTVALDIEKIVGVVVELYAPAARMRVFHTELPRQAGQVVKRGLMDSTKDACNEQRMDLLKQLERVQTATRGIRQIATCSVAS